MRKKSSLSSSELANVEAMLDLLNDKYEDSGTKVEGVIIISSQQVRLPVMWDASSEQYLVWTS